MFGSKFRFGVQRKVQYPIIIFIAALSLFMFLYFPNQQETALRSSYEGEARAIAQTVAFGVQIGLQHEDYPAVQAVIDSAVSREGVVFVALVDSGKTFTAHPEGFVYNERYATSDTMVVNKYRFQSAFLSGEVVVGRSTAPIQRQLQQIKRTSMFVALLTLFFGVFFGLMQGRMIVKPIAQLRMAAKKFGLGDLRTEVKPTSNDEIGDLATEFGRMIENVRAAQEKFHHVNMQLLLKNVDLREQQEVLEEQAKKIELANQQLTEKTLELEREHQALKESEESLRLLFESAPIPLVLFSAKDAHLLLANKALHDLLEIEEDQTPSETANIIADPTIWAFILDRVRDSGKLDDIEVEMFTHKGNKRTVSLSMRTMMYGNEPSQEVRLADITERKHAENEIRAKNAELTDANEEILRQQAIIEAERKNLAEALDILKSAQSQLIQSEKMAALGHLIAGIVHEINTPLGAIRASIGNIDHAIEMNLSKLPQLYSLLKPEEIPLFYGIVNKAVTSKQTLSSREMRAKRRELQQELEALNIPKADEYADTITEMGLFDSFDMFKPLIGSEHFPEILQAGARLSLIRRNSHNIMTAIERASKIVFALKSYAHFDATGERKQANVIDGIETVLTLYHNQLKHGVEIIRSYEDVPPVLCFPDELDQVWTNLIHNAGQAMEYKGRLEIAVNQVNGFIRVCVIDSGPGVPEEIREKIFEPFFTTKPAGEGSGLGLDIVLKIVRKHNGRIELDSKPGMTCFSVYVPVETAPVEQPTETSPA